jgi:hypothetical protein
MSDAIVKNLNFGEDARVNVFKGIEKLTQAVSSTVRGSHWKTNYNQRWCNGCRFYNTARPSRKHGCYAFKRSSTQDGARSR